MNHKETERMLGVSDVSRYLNFTELFLEAQKLVPANRRVYTFTKEQIESASGALIRVRNNPIGDGNDVHRNNDIMITKQNTIIPPGIIEKIVDTYIVTLDPRTRKDGMFFIEEQVHLMHTGRHKWLPWRKALRQDRGKYNYTIYGRRYKNVGKKNQSYDIVNGYFTINVHDTGGFVNSSLGCTIIANDNTFKKFWVPFIVDIEKYGKPDFIPSIVLESGTFNQACKNLKLI